MRVAVAESDPTELFIEPWSELLLAQLRAGPFDFGKKLARTVRYPIVVVTRCPHGIQRRPTEGSLPSPPPKLSFRLGKDFLGRKGFRRPCFEFTAAALCFR
jgi:hypothetical protein